MIHYLLQSYSSHPALSAGRVPPGLLTQAEQAFFNGLKSDKRRHDWLLGRWTGKRLVQAVMGNGIPLDGVEILAAEDGAPVVSIQYSVFSDQGSMPNHESRITSHASLTLSISHSADRAFCGVVEGAGVPLGVDIERIEERTEGFVGDYFVRDEIALVETTPRENRAGVVTAIWSAKEAALKAIRLGLLADTFAVKCLPQGSGVDWSPIAITWDESKLKKPAPALTGWWRVWNDFVLTIACPARSPHGIEQSLTEAKVLER